MALNQATENNNSHLTCPICYEQLKDPLRANCNHGFCKTCLLGWMELGNRTCPICRKKLYLMVQDTLEEMVQEGCIDFAEQPSIEALIEKRKATHRPITIHVSDEYMRMMADRPILKYGGLIPIVLFICSFLMMLYCFIDSICDPPFTMLCLLRLILYFCACFGGILCAISEFIAYTRGSSRMNAALMSGAQLRGHLWHLCDLSLLYFSLTLLMWLKHSCNHDFDHYLI